MDRSDLVRAALADLLIALDPASADRIGAILIRCGSALQDAAAQERATGPATAAVELLLHAADTNLPLRQPSPTPHRKRRRRRANPLHLAGLAAVTAAPTPA